MFKVETDRIKEMIEGNYDFIDFVFSKIKDIEKAKSPYVSSILATKHQGHFENHNLYSWYFNLETYPFLLTRAVEGINESDPWKIDIFYLEPGGWNWSYKDYMIEGASYECADRAKEAALLYVKSLEDKYNE